MSARLTCLLSLILLGAFVATPGWARTHGKTHGKTAKTSVPAAPSLIWRGDVATEEAIVSEAANAWEKTGHGHIELQPFNTASGIDAVSNGSADIAGSARGSDGSSQNSGLTFTPVAWDALVLITNSANPVPTLTLKQVHDIYYGKITRWEEVGGSNAPIDLYAVASPGDGVEFSLRDLLFGRGNQPVAAPRLYVNTHKLEEAVALNPNGLGVATLADIRSRSKLKAIPIDGVVPNVANIADGSYPLFTPLYLVTNPRSVKAAQAQAFVDFVQTDAGKAAMRTRAVLPYADGSALIAMDSARRDRILTQVGARPRSATPPLSAPGATYAARAAVAPTSPDTLAAKIALDRRTAAAKAPASAATAVAQVEASPTTYASPAVAAAVPAATASKTATSYTVVKGDTLSSIAQKHSVQVAQLREWNRLKNDNLQLGQVLRLSSN
ncbi:MAG: substrate-binding domain-containing protein [Rhodanobacter sp.]